MTHCKDCQHFDYAHGSEYCRRPRLPADGDDFTGNGAPRVSWARLERQSKQSHRCGPDAKHFAPLVQP